MEIRSLGRIIVDVLEAKKWFQRIGIATDGTRLEQIDRYLHELLNPTAPTANPFGSDPTGPGAYHALSEAAGFGRIARNFSSIPSHLLPRQALKDALGGPFKLSAEPAGGTGDARNKFVELELAAYCLESGISVTGFDDLRFDFERCPYIVECKRPLQRGTVEQNISKAYRQLRARLKEHERGVVAVAVDRAFGLDAGFHQVSSVTDFRRIAVTVAEDFRALVTPMSGTWIDPRVVSIAAIVRFLAKPRNADGVAYSYQVALVKLSSEDHGRDRV
jgi:hypothetical protein